MELDLRKTHGLRNDLLLTVRRAEVEDALFHIANRVQLIQLPGLLRHVPEQDATERQRVNDCKIPVEEHLKQLTQRGARLVDVNGRPRRPVILIGSRNVGNNHGFLAWQRDENPKLFHVRGEPFNYPSYSCLIRCRDGRLTIRPLRFEADRVLDDGTDITEDVTWCAYANWVLRNGNVISIEDIMEQFAVLRHPPRARLRPAAS